VPRAITEPNGSYIYETMLKTTNFEDVKAYTVGHDYCHAETRKSPVVDGVVKRNTHGKEVRYVTHLSTGEKEMAAKITRGFAQLICGFDLLRANGRSYVIDVNGFSFVKDNEGYYHDCSVILKGLFYREKLKRESMASDEASTDGNAEIPQAAEASRAHPHRNAIKAILKSPSISKLSALRHHQSGASSPKSGSLPLSSPPTIERPTESFSSSPVVAEPAMLPPPTIPPPAAAATPAGKDATKAAGPPPMPNSKHSWKLKGVVAVIRHADRTPKQKCKATFHTFPFVDLLKGHEEEVLLRGEAALSSVQAAIRTAQRQKLEDEGKLRNVQNVLNRKKTDPSCKVQIKPMFRKRMLEDEIRTDAVSATIEPSIPGHVEAGPSETPSSPLSNDELTKTPSRKDSLTGPTFSRYVKQEQGLILDKLTMVVKW
jgi:inositol-hexakisphosphate/diphosphoinositol-pentakisphosphate 1-kinase